MNEPSCAHEDDVVAAVLTGAWAHGDFDELRAHAAGCDICGEVATVAVLLHDDDLDARRRGPLPAAGQVWWRAAVRSRLESAQSATAPIGWLHGITAALVVGAVLAVIGAGWPAIIIAVGWAQGAAAVPGGLITGPLLDVLRQSAALAALAVACFVIAPVAFYFALSSD